MSELFDLEIYNSGHKNCQLEEMVCGRLILDISLRVPKIILFT